MEKEWRILSFSFDSCYTLFGDNMKNITFRRFGAYLIDIILIGILGMSLSYLSFFHSNEEQYKEMTQEIINLYELYDNNEITMTEYREKSISLSYDLNRNNWLNTTLNMIFLVLYFMLLPIFMGGQTIGKKILKIKVVGHNDHEKVSAFSYFVRAVIQNNILITLAQLLILFLFSKENYYFMYSNVNMVGYILLYFIVFLVLIRKDSRGLHDLIAGTKVVSVSQEEEMIKPVAETEKVQDAILISEEVVEDKKPIEKKVSKPKKSTRQSTSKLSQEENKEQTKLKNTSNKKSTKSKK